MLFLTYSEQHVGILFTAASSLDVMSPSSVCLLPSTISTMDSIIIFQSAVFLCALEAPGGIVM